MLELGIYGGTFAPVHIGHVAAAEAFFNTLSLDKLLIIPTLIPPHKTVCFPDNPNDRLEMLHLAFKTHPEYEKKIFISDYELGAPPPSYTVNTLEHFTEDGTHITFLCGTDMFLTLDSWRSPERIFALCRIALMLREENASEELLAQIETKKAVYAERFGADIVTVHAPAIEISSSAIRAGDDDMRKRYLPKAVYDYVKEHGLYERIQ